MPTPPTASTDQRVVIQDLALLARQAVTNITNQITAVDQQIAKLQEAQTLFQERYDFWEDFIGYYDRERLFLTGQILQNPVVQADFDAFLAQDPAGRLYNNAAPIPERFAPKRISQFDGTPLISSPTVSETIRWGREADLNDYFRNGFASAGPTGHTTNTVLTSTSTTLEVEGSDTSPPYQVGSVLLILRAGVAGALVRILSVTPLGGSDPYQYGLGIELLTPVLSANCPVNSQVLLSWTGFTNTERSTKTASLSARQKLMDTMVASYAARVLEVEQNNLSPELVEVQSNSAEDQPDTVYNANLQGAITQIQSWYSTQDVSDAGLSGIAALNAQRVAAIPQRNSWILNRMESGTGGSGAYDGRYNYANRLYNLTDGIIKTVEVLESQKQQLLDQQVLANERAALYDQELY